MEQLTRIMEKLESMDDKMNAMDTAIRGDENRGVVGMKQHMLAFRSDLEAHIAEDAKQFTWLNRLKWGSVAVGAVGAFLLTVAEVISKFVHA